MIIETAALGSIEITVEQIYRFEKGIPGFEEETEFALISIEDSPFFHLQSLKEKHLSFLLVDPFIFFPEYEFELGSSETAALDIHSDIMVRSIVTLHEEIEKSTMNVLAPIVLNPENRRGLQVVLHNSSYPTKHLLWQNDPISSENPAEGGE